MNASGHLWTIGALVRRTLFPTTPPVSEAWSTVLHDPDVGPVTVRGRLSRAAGERDLVILIHGLGGSSNSDYMASAARAARSLGLASLRLNLRGADGRGSDLYHGGLTADLHAAIADASALGFERTFVLGFSLGGHVAIRLATEVSDPKVAAIAAVCSPLDLAAGADALDQANLAIYRTYILRHLLANYRITAGLGKAPTPPEKLDRVRTLRKWDSLTVVPRFGFKDPDDYYAQASVGSRLGELRRPTFLLAVENDPMIPPSAIRPALEAAADTDAVRRLLTVRWLDRGGHLGFPKRLDLGLEGPRGMESQVLLWLLRAGAAPPASPGVVRREV